ncbi:MAG: hypothetical protein HYY18_06535 [Planctomycetes bacterium]|nr:hypothetical protein [Planctomycetota bacterium]
MLVALGNSRDRVEKQAAQAALEQRRAWFLAEKTLALEEEMEMAGALAGGPCGGDVADARVEVGQLGRRSGQEAFAEPARGGPAFLRGSGEEAQRVGVAPDAGIGRRLRGRIGSGPVRRAGLVLRGAESVGRRRRRFNGKTAGRTAGPSP